MMTVCCCMRELEWPLFVLACVWGGVAGSVLLLCNRQWSVLWQLVDCTPPGSGCVSEPDLTAQSGTSLLVHWWTSAWLGASSRSFPRVRSYWNAVCKLLHAITESSASGSSLSLELFCRSNFIHQTQVYFPPSGLCLVASHFSVNLTCQFGWCVASFVTNVLKCWLWDKCCFPFVKILCRKHI